MTPTKTVLFILAFIFFFAGLPMDYGLLPSWLDMLPDLLIFGLLFCSLLQRVDRNLHVYTVGLPFVLAIVIIAVLSTFVTERPLIECPLFLRKLLRFYLLFIALINIELGERKLRWIIGLLATCFVIQIPVAIARIPFEGVFHERVIGAYAYRGGGPSTTIPVVATGFLMSYFIAYRRSKWFLIALVAFVLFGLLGGKKAVFLAVPIAGIFAIINVKSISIRKIRIPVRLIAMSLVLFCTIFYISVRLQPKLNPEQRAWGSFDVSFLKQFVVSYVTRKNEEGATSGRVSTTIRSVNYISDNMSHAIFGYGPGYLMKSRFAGVGRTNRDMVEGVRIDYGITGFVYLILQIGFPASFIWLSFYGWCMVRMRKSAQKEPSPFWYAFYLGMVCHTFFVILISVTYNSSMLHGDLHGFSFFVLLAVAFRRKFNRQKVYGKQGTTPRQAIGALPTESGKAMQAKNWPKANPY